MPHWTRAAGWLLVGAALLLSTGGVALGSCCGGEGSDGAAVGCPSDCRAKTGDEGLCGAEAPPAAPPASLRLPLPAAAGSAVPLNTRGYNYGDPGEYRPPVPPAPKRRATDASPTQP